MFCTIVLEIYNGVLESRISQKNLNKIKRLLETFLKTTEWSVKTFQKKKNEFCTLVLMISGKPVIADSIKFII